MSENYLAYGIRNPAKRKKVNGWLKKYSHDEKERCSFEKYLKERVHYEEMSDNQLNEHYITNKAKYEYKKVVLTLCGITIFLTMFFGIGDTFLDISMKILEFSIIENSNAQLSSVAFFISVFLVITIAVILFLLLISYIENIYIVYRRVLLIENVIEVRKEQGGKK